VVIASGALRACSFVYAHQRLWNISFLASSGPLLTTAMEELSIVVFIVAGEVFWTVFMRV